MPTRQLYNLRLPQDDQTNTSREGLGRQLEALVGLNEDVPNVEELGVNTGDRTIDVAYSNQYAAKIAAELEELLTANGFTSLPYYTPSQPGRSGDGYVTIDDGSVETASVHDDRFQTVSATFTQVGNQGSHRRTLRVQPAEVARNDYGNDETALVAIPSAAGKRVWYDRETQSRDQPTVVATHTGEFADVDLVDATATSMTTSDHKIDLVYEVPYDVEYQTGVTLWDTRGHYSRDDKNGELQWQKCYRTDHEFDGAPLVDTRRLRLRLDESKSIEAWTWTASSRVWSPLSLGSSDWTLRDVDVTGVTPVKVEAQCEFENTSNGDLFALNMVARRGRQEAHWLVPESVSEVTPSGLQSKLDPIADASVVRPQESKELIDRNKIKW